MPRKRDNDDTFDEERKERERAAARRARRKKKEVFESLIHEVEKLRSEKEAICNWYESYRDPIVLYSKEKHHVVDLKVKLSSAGVTQQELEEPLLSMNKLRLEYWSSVSSRVEELVRGIQAMDYVEAFLRVNDSWRILSSPEAVSGLTEEQVALLTEGIQLMGGDAAFREYVATHIDLCQESHTALDCIRRMRELARELASVNAQFEQLAPTIKSAAAQSVSRMHVKTLARWYTWTHDRLDDLIHAFVGPSSGPPFSSQPSWRPTRPPLGPHNLPTPPPPPQPTNLHPPIFPISTQPHPSHRVPSTGPAPPPPPPPDPSGSTPTSPPNLSATQSPASFPSQSHSPFSMEYRSSFPSQSEPSIAPHSHWTPPDQSNPSVLDRSHSSHTDRPNASIYSQSQGSTTGWPMTSPVSYPPRVYQKSHHHPRPISTRPTDSIFSTGPSRPLESIFSTVSPRPSDSRSEATSSRTDSVFGHNVKVHRPAESIFSPMAEGSCSPSSAVGANTPSKAPTPWPLVAVAPDVQPSSFDSSFSASIYSRTNSAVSAVGLLPTSVGHWPSDGSSERSGARSRPLRRSKSLEFSLSHSHEKIHQSFGTPPRSRDMSRAHSDSDAEANAPIVRRSSSPSPATSRPSLASGTHARDDHSGPRGVGASVRAGARAEAESDFWSALKAERDQSQAAQGTHSPQGTHNAEATGADASVHGSQDSLVSHYTQGPLGAQSSYLPQGLQNPHGNHCTHRSHDSHAHHSAQGTLATQGAEGVVGSTSSCDFPYGVGQKGANVPWSINRKLGPAAPWSRRLTEAAPSSSDSQSPQSGLDASPANQTSGLFLESGKPVCSSAEFPSPSPSRGAGSGRSLSRSGGAPSLAPVAPSNPLSVSFDLPVDQEAPCPVLFLDPRALASDWAKDCPIPNGPVGDAEFQCSDTVSRDVGTIPVRSGPCKLKVDEGMVVPKVDDLKIDAIVDGMDCLTFPDQSGDLNLDWPDLLLYE